MSNKDSNDPDFDKILAELEKEGEESNVIIEKQVEKNKDEKKHKDENGRDYDEYIDVSGEPPEVETGEDFW